MAVSAQPNLSRVPRVLQGSGSKHGPHTAASIYWEGAEEADTPPAPYPQIYSTRNAGWGGGAGLVICVSPTPRRCRLDSG